jgi:hypothetical protein
VKRDRTPAILASPGLPPAGTDQAELRRLRRGRHLHVYPATFDIALEVEAVCSSLGVRVMLRDHPGFYFDEVDALCDAVHLAACQLTTSIARAAAAPHISRLPIDARGQEMKRILAAQPRPPRPVVDEKAINTGAWISTLIRLVEPLVKPLSALLGAASVARSAPTVSQQLETLLRGIDDAARALARRLKAAESRPAVAPPNRFEAVTQDQCREARRTGRHFYWPPNWDLAAEVAAVCEPLALLVAALSDPGRAAPELRKVVEAVHEAVVEIANMIARSDAAARTRNVPVDHRATATRLVLDLAPPPPARPVITQAAILAGTWPALLVALAAPYAAPLAALLGAGVVLRGGESVSDRLDEALARIDSAALNLTRRIERIEARPAVAAVAPAADKADKARAELARLGVPLP